MRLTDPNPETRINHEELYAIVLEDPDFISKFSQKSSVFTNKPVHSMQDQSNYNTRASLSPEIAVKSDLYGTNGLNMKVSMASNNQTNNTLFLKASVTSDFSNQNQFEPAVFNRNTPQNDLRYSMLMTPMQESPLKNKF